MLLVERGRLVSPVQSSEWSWRYRTSGQRPNEVPFSCTDSTHLHEVMDAVVTSAIDVPGDVALEDPVTSELEDCATERCSLASIWYAPRCVQPALRPCRAVRAAFSAAAIAGGVGGASEWTSRRYGEWPAGVLTYQSRHAWHSLVYRSASLRDQKRSQWRQVRERQAR